MGILNYFNFLQIIQVYHLKELIIKLIPQDKILMMTSLKKIINHFAKMIVVIITIIITTIIVII